MPAEAITVHKSQGSTLNAVCVVLKNSFSNRRMDRKSLYVALSRSTSLNGLYLIGKFEAPQPINPNDKAVLAMERLKSEKVLTTNFQLLKTISATDVFKIYSLNVQSLPKHLQGLQTDILVQLCDLLCFQEIWAKVDQQYFIPNYTEMIRNSTASQQHRGKGTIIYSKSPNDTENCGHISIVNGFKHLEYTYVSFKNTLIINCYLSANITMDMVEESFNKIASQINTAQNVLIMGDVNMDHLKDQPIQRFFNSLGLVLLSPSKATTNGKTMFDIVYSRLNDYRTEVSIMPCYFSYHDGIVIKIKYPF